MSTIITDSIGNFYYANIYKELSADFEVYFAISCVQVNNNWMHNSSTEFKPDSS